MKTVVGVLVAALVLASAPAGAQVLDLNTVRCKEFSESGKETIALIMMWMEGYNTEEDDPAVIDFDKIKLKTEKLTTYCTDNPTIGLMTAAEIVLWK